jgi:hypothetical protein
LAAGQVVDLREVVRLTKPRLEHSPFADRHVSDTAKGRGHPRSREHALLLNLLELPLSVASALIKALPYTLRKPVVNVSQLDLIHRRPPQSGDVRAST